MPDKEPKTFEGKKLVKNIKINTYLVTENGKTIKYVVERDNSVGPFRDCAEFMVPQRYYEKKDEKRVLRKMYSLFPLTQEVFVL